MSSLFPLRLRAYLRHPRVRPVVVTAFWSFVTFYFVFAALILTTRWYLLPQIDRFKDDIAGILSEATDSEVSIGAVSPRWDGFWPQIHLSDVRFVKRDASPAHDEMLVLPKLSATFNWSSALGTVSLRSLSVHNAALSIRRTAPAVYDVGGFTIDLTKPRESNSDDTTLEWISLQDQIHITDSSLRYIDLTARYPKEILFSHLDLSFLKAFSEWKLGFQAHQIIDDAAYPVDIRARFEKSLFASPNDLSAWSGQLYGHWENVDFADIIRNTTPIDIVQTAQGGGEFWLDFADARVTAIRSDVQFDAVQLQMAKDLEPVRVTDLSATITQKLVGDTLDFDIDNLSYTAHDNVAVGPVDINTRVKVTPDLQDTKAVSIDVSRVDLKTMLRSVRTTPIPDSIKSLIASFNPTGTLTGLHLGWTGSYKTPSDIEFEGEFSGLSIAPQPKRRDDGTETVGIPGVENLAGHVRASETGGTVTLSSNDCTIHLPGLFPDPIKPLKSLTGQVHWTMPGDAPFEVRIQDVDIQHFAAHVVANGSWKATGGAGTLDLKADIVEGKADEHWHFLPTILHAGTRQWLEGGLRGGYVRNGEAIIRGELKDFPWTKPGTDGRFYIETELDNVVLDYVPSYRRDAKGRYIGGENWPLLTDIQGKLIFDGLAMRVIADSANTHGAHVSKAFAEIPSLVAGHNLMLNIDGTITEAPMRNMIDYLDKSPIGAILGNAFAKTEATGRAGLDLRLEIPLLHAQDTRVKGRVHLNNNDFDMKWPVPPLTEAKGYVDFSHRGASTDNLSAKAFGQPVTATIETKDRGVVGIRAKGAVPPEAILFFNDEPLLKEGIKPLKGLAPVDVSVVVGKGVTVDVKTDLTGVTSDYPMPMDKTADASWPTRFTFEPVKRRDRSGHLLSLNVADRFSMQMQIGNGSARPLSTRGTFSLGRQATLPKTGFELELVAKEAHLDQWMGPIMGFVQAAKSATRDKQTARTDGPTLETIAVDIDRLWVDDMAFTNVHANTRQRTDNVWRTIVTSDHVEGTVVWDTTTAGLGTIEGKLAKLHLPATSSDRIKSILTESEEMQMPSIRAKADDVRIGQMRLGSVTLETDNTRDADGPVWKINTLEVTNPDATLKGEGAWRFRNGQNRTQMQTSLTLANAGGLFDRLGFKDMVHSGQGRIDVDLSWNDKPWSPHVPSLNGGMTVDLQKGSLEQVDTGAGGALLSLVSMRSLMKRLTLDFTDLAYKGLNFDTMTGSHTLVNGMISTVDTEVASEHGSILIDGSADLVSEQCDYRVLVLPDINAGGASLAMAFVNPAVGLGTFVAQMVLREPLSRLFSVQYNVKGSFTDPTIEKTTHQTKSVNELESNGGSDR